MSIHRGKDADVGCVHTHTHAGILVIKKNKILPFGTTRMDLEGITLGKINPRKANTPYDFTYM